MGAIGFLFINRRGQNVAILPPDGRLHQCISASFHKDYTCFYLIMGVEYLFLIEASILQNFLSMTYLKNEAIVDR